MARKHIQLYLGHIQPASVLWGIHKLKPVPQRFCLIWRKEITEANIKALHRLFYYRIDAKQAGKYRKRRVIITGTDFIPPLPDQIPELMKDFVDRIPVYRQANHPIEYAAILHKELVTIHPFIDGNGRVARFLMNLALLQAGYPIAVIPPVLRREYLNSLNMIHRGNQRPFINLIAGVCYESAKEYLRLLEGG
ncbi:MAG: Fic family protein [Proteobacteria bacterium]|nr:Fic family protein [Pseudomonadota bacterium]